jgi:hypothetical protein
MSVTPPPLGCVPRFQRSVVIDSNPHFCLVTPGTPHREHVCACGAAWSTLDNGRRP